MAATPPIPKTASKGGLTKKWHGAPTWVWVAGGGVLAGVVYFLYARHKTATTPAATTTNAGKYPGINQVVVPVPVGSNPPGSPPPAPPPPPPGTPGAATHQYTSTIDGDTLQGLARRVYGGTPGCANGECWPFILQANLEKLASAANARRLIFPNTPGPDRMSASTPLWGGIVLETDNPTPPGAATPAPAPAVQQNATIPPGTNVTAVLSQGSAAYPVPAGVASGPMAA